jgi:NAD(P)-dependent dehydrogenase (short-subunit alcohol dehydrogenase family)
MLKSGGGSIINMSSTSGHMATAGATLYVSSKHAIEGATKCVALEYAGKGIRVNTIAPALILDTEMSDRILMLCRSIDALKALEVGMLKAHPSGFGRAQDVTRIILFLLDPANTYITGTSIPCDGGYLAGRTY